MSKVIVGMSGGVDSAVAAYLLKMAGHEVIGITLRTWESGEEAEKGESRCCEIDEARRTAWKLGIPFHALNCLAAFRERVISPFIEDYLQGRTPNPCVLCNQAVKWERLLYMADVLQADYVASGHYASIVRLTNGRLAVRQGSDARKDQSYMLYRLTQEQLSRTLLPLGTYSKERVREIAADAGLPAAEKADSQEICFVPEGTSYAGFIEKNAAAFSADPADGTSLPQEAGKCVDELGNVLGQHKGILHYTVGQRKGLGLALGFPAYVKEIRPAENEVVIGGEQSLYQKEIRLGDMCYMGISENEIGQGYPVLARIRYHHAGSQAMLRQEGDTARLLFEEAVRAPAPGQSAVCYDAEGAVLCGGKILPGL